MSSTTYTNEEAQRVANDMRGMTPGAVAEFPSCELTYHALRILQMERRAMNTRSGSRGPLDGRTFIVESPLYPGLF